MKFIILLIIHLILDGGLSSVNGQTLTKTTESPSASITLEFAIESGTSTIIAETDSTPSEQLSTIVRDINTSAAVLSERSSSAANSYNVRLFLLWQLFY